MVAMSDESNLSREISNKLSKLIALTKLSNSKIIAEAKTEINGDPVFQAILALADGDLSSSQIKDKVIEQTSSSKATVERRIAELIEKGALVATRKGHEIYYTNSGLYD